MNVGILSKPGRRSVTKPQASICLCSGQSPKSTKGILRGLHFQKQHPQGKLVMVSLGEVFDVAVDIRKGSPTFGKWFGAILNQENQNQLWIPPGMAHGFVVLSDVAHFHYKCTDFYHPGMKAQSAGMTRRLGLTGPIRKNRFCPQRSDRSVLQGRSGVLTDESTDYRRGWHARPYPAA